MGYLEVLLTRLEPLAVIELRIRVLTFVVNIPAFVVRLFGCH